MLGRLLLVVGSELLGKQPTFIIQIEGTGLHFNTFVNFHYRITVQLYAIHFQRKVLNRKL